MCKKELCKKQPNFNSMGETKPLYCATHKLEGMVNVRHKTCIYPDCKTLPSYNNKEETKYLYCAKHKLDDMIDLKHKKCIYLNCKTLPTFNNYGEKNALYCVKHKIEGMINIIMKCVYIQIVKYNQSLISNVKKKDCIVLSID